MGEWVMGTTLGDYIGIHYPVPYYAPGSPCQPQHQEAAGQSHHGHATLLPSLAAHVYFKKPGAVVVFRGSTWRFMGGYK